MAVPSARAILAKRSPNNVKLLISLPSSSLVVPYSHCNAPAENTNANVSIPVGRKKLYFSLSIKFCFYKCDINVVERAVITVGAAQNLFLGEGTRQDYGMIRFDAEPFDVEESYMRLMMES